MNDGEKNPDTLTREADGIVSVNNRGGSSSNTGGKVIFVLAVLTILVIGGLISFNKWRAAKKESEAIALQTGKNENKPAQVGNRRRFDSDPPPLPIGATKTPAAPNPTYSNTTVGVCSDGLVGTALLGPDGKPIMSVGNIPMRVCKDGRVMVPAIQAMGEAGSAGPAGKGTMAAATPPSRYAGDAIVPAPNSLIGGAKLPTGTAASLSTLQDLLTKTGAISGGGLGMGGGGPSGAGGPSESAPQAAPQGALAEMLEGTQTTAVKARMLGDRNMILPKGRTIDCALSTRIINEVAGMATCVLSQNAYSDNGKFVLLDAGSEVTGEYKSAMQQGQRRLFVLWTRAKTPKGVVIELASPASDSLGTSGLDGFVDNHWPDRIGAAFLLSVVQDAIGYETAKAQGSNGSTNVGVYQSSTKTSDQMSKTILDSTINIKPTLYKNQGDRAAIFVARDLDFGGVYALSAN
jgi:type IV secretion system protein VirB10